MRSRRLLAVVVAALALLAGCGIPEGTGVRDDGAGPSEPLGDPDTGLEPPHRVATREPDQFVRNFLSSPAGDLAGAAERQRLFLTKQDAADWKPPKGINVISLTEDPLITGKEVVLKDVQHVGTLGDNGILEPRRPQEPAQSTYTFRVGLGEDEQSGLFVSQPPPLILMTLDALDAYYEPRVIYFWNTDHTGLVPDVRYLARSIPRAQRPNRVLDWLIAGPSPWLEPAVEPLPDGTQAPGNVPDPSTGHLVVNLNAAALTGDADQLDRLGSQLRWSLRPDSQGDLELKIDNQPKKTFSGDAYLGDNPESRSEATQWPFCVFQERVRRISPPSQPTDVPVDDKFNRQVQSAALARTDTGDQIMGALVRRLAGDDQLWIGGGAVPAYRKVGSAANMSRPTWLAGPGGAGLVAADGKLYQFARGRKALSGVALAGSKNNVTAVATPPDGQRMAYIDGGRLYVAALRRDGGKLTEVGDPREVPTPFSTVMAVAWSGEGRLMTAGSRGDNGRTALFEVSVDGGQRREEVASLGRAKVTQLAAYPDDPSTTTEDRRVMYEADGAAFELFSEPKQLTARDLQPPQNLDIPPTAPFFLE
ncbi:MAG TPA: LpqB family beta-propeller domain-containing protein [Micromonosporaceae bacterium]|jgi:hypothetical protein